MHWLKKKWGRTFFRQRQIDCQIGVISKTLKQWTQYKWVETQFTSTTYFVLFFSLKKVRLQTYYIILLHFSLMHNAQFFKRVKYLIGMKVNFFSNILPAAAKVRKILPWDIFFIQIKCNKWCIPFYHEISLTRVSVFQWNSTFCFLHLNFKADN